jgi:hypothetical protein
MDISLKTSKKLWMIITPIPYIRYHNDTVKFNIVLPSASTLCLTLSSGWCKMCKLAFLYGKTYTIKCNTKVNRIKNVPICIANNNKQHYINIYIFIQYIYNIQNQISTYTGRVLYICCVALYDMSMQMNTLQVEQFTIRCHCCKASLLQGAWRPTGLQNIKNAVRFSILGWLGRPDALPTPRRRGAVRLTMPDSIEDAS